MLEGLQRRDGFWVCWEDGQVGIELGVRRGGGELAIGGGFGGGQLRRRRGKMGELLSQGGLVGSGERRRLRRCGKGGSLVPWLL